MIFISYAREDIELVSQIVNSIQAIGLSVWFDQDRLKPGHPWEPKIEGAIDRCNAAIIFVSEFTLQKKSYLEKEIDLLIEKQNKISTNQDVFILPILIGSGDISGSKLDRLQFFDYRDTERANIGDLLSHTLNSFNISVELKEKSLDQARVNDRKKVTVDEDRQLAPGTNDCLFGPDDFGIYVNKATMDGYIFHGKPLGNSIEKLIYYTESQSVAVLMKDGTMLDLGSKIQWLIRPYFSKLSEISIVQTKDGESIEGFIVPIEQKPISKYLSERLAKQALGNGINMADTQKSFWKKILEHFVSKFTV
ncbi:toll/interleukin-1 receptor domain-containing protein [Hoeflea sp.]|uniref:toll/interleukin-1 receptor domain-containing protein n=1 Tax=Hoeflea sp. TaxID=1940281 RepID=UPI003A91D39E